MFHQTSYGGNEDVLSLYELLCHGNEWFYSCGGLLTDLLSLLLEKANQLSTFGSDV